MKGRHKMSIYLTDEQFNRLLDIHSVERKKAGKDFPLQNIVVLAFDKMCADINAQGGDE